MSAIKTGDNAGQKSIEEACLRFAQGNATVQEILDTIAIHQPARSKIHVEEAPVWNGSQAGDPMPACHPQQWPALHKCGHISRVLVWADAAQRKHQLSLIEKHGYCSMCANRERSK